MNCTQLTEQQITASLFAVRPITVIPTAYITWPHTYTLRWPKTITYATLCNNLIALTKRL